MCLTWAMSYIEMPGIHLLRVPEAGSCRDAVDWFEIDLGHEESQWSSWKLSLAVMSVSESSENLSQSFWFYLFLSFFLGSALRSPLLLCLALVSWLSTPGIQPYPAVSCVALFIESSLLLCLSPLSLTLLHLGGMRNTSTTGQKTKNTEPWGFMKLEILMLKFWINYRRHWDPRKDLQKRAGHSKANLRSLLSSSDKIPMVRQRPVLRPLHLYYTSCEHVRFWSWDRNHRKGSWEWVSPPPLSSPRITSRFQYLLEKKCNWSL